MNFFNSAKKGGQISIHNCAKSLFFSVWSKLLVDMVYIFEPIYTHRHFTPCGLEKIQIKFKVVHPVLVCESHYRCMLCHHSTLEEDQLVGIIKSTNLHDIHAHDKCASTSDHNCIILKVPSYDQPLKTDDRPRPVLSSPSPLPRARPEWREGKKESRSH